jgi:hypothetical protein
MFRLHTLSTIAVAAVVTAALAACGSKVLDFRNAEIVNGKVYASGANEPFSGRLTNVPVDKLMLPQRGFEILSNVVSNSNAVIPASLRALQSFAGASNALMLLPDALCDADFSGGAPSGKITCTSPRSETVQIQAAFNEGVLDGDFVLFDASGKQPIVNATFRHGLPDGKLEIHSPTTGKLVHTGNLDNGVLSGKEEAFDPTTGNRVLSATLVNGLYDGTFTRYAPDGKQMTLQASYVQGKLDGNRKSWNEDGKLVADQMFAHDVEVGADGTAISDCVSEWNDAFHAVPDARPVEPTSAREQWQASCREGKHPLRGASATPEAAPATPVALTAHAERDECVDAWTAAFHQENGKDAPVSTEQLGEWKAWCDGGRRPS